MSRVPSCSSGCLSGLNESRGLPLVNRTMHARRKSPGTGAPRLSQDIDTAQRHGESGLFLSAPLCPERSSKSRATPPRAPSRRTMKARKPFRRKFNPMIPRMNDIQESSPEVIAAPKSKSPTEALNQPSNAVLNVRNGGRSWQIDICPRGVGVRSQIIRFHRSPTRLDRSDSRLGDCFVFLTPSSPLLYMPPLTDQVKSERPHPSPFWRNGAFYSHPPKQSRG